MRVAGIDKRVHRTWGSTAKWLSMCRLDGFALEGGFFGVGEGVFGFGGG